MRYRQSALPLRCPRRYNSGQSSSPAKKGASRSERARLLTMPKCMSIQTDYLDVISLYSETLAAGSRAPSRD